MTENKADPLRDILRCIETIEGAYNFECEAGPLKNCGEWKYLKRLCGVGATPQLPAPDHLPKMPDDDLAKLSAAVDTVSSTNCNCLIYDAAKYLREQIADVRRVRAARQKDKP